MNKTIVNVVGLPGSGKSAVCRALREEHGFEVFSPSGLIREYAQGNGLSLDGRAGYVTAHERMIVGDPLVMIRGIDQLASELICLDGLRAPITMEYLRERRGAVSVFLDCTDELRFQRVCDDEERTGTRRFATLEDFLADELPDYVNPNRYLPNMIEMRETADYVIDTAPLSALNVCERIRLIALARG